MSQPKSKNKHQHDSPEQQNQPSFDLGSYLKGMRSEHNISLEDLSNHLKIRISNLEAIENNQPLEHIPEAYFRGYIKNYCMFFGVDPDGVLSHVQKSTSTHTPKPVYNNGGSAFHFSSNDGRSNSNRKSIINQLPIRSLLIGSLVIGLSFLVFKLISGNKKQNQMTQSYVTHSGLERNRLQSSSEF